MSDWREELARDIRHVLGAAGANEVAITMSGRQATELARLLDLAGMFSSTSFGWIERAKVVGRSLTPHTEGE